MYYIYPKSIAMKKLFTLLTCSLALSASAQIEGTWRLAPNAGALAVGPSQGDGSYWSNSINDVTTRACLFDDSITFAAGTMSHYMDGSTWLEAWQGVAQDGCGVPVAPHDGTTNAPFTYAYNSATGELTVNGVGAHLGLAKVINGSELSSPSLAPSSITYLVAFNGANDTMNVDISVGGAWWHYTYVKSSIWQLANPNVTFKVNMSDYTGTIGSGVYINGSFNGWCGTCNPMTDMGNGIWETTLPLAQGAIEYKFTVDGWTDEEIFTGSEPCLDPVADAFNNRYLNVVGDVTLPAVCWESCDPCVTVDPQLVGTWKLKGEAGSLAVGPSLGNGSWFSISAADIVTRSCLFDDSIRFELNGAMTHYMDGNTWLETWQGVAQDGCGAPVSPHDGTTNAPYTYSYNSVTGELTTFGVGAHIGLPKVYNGGELTNPSNAPSSITYQVTLSPDNNTLTADINFGPGWWRFIYERTQPIVVATPNVTFRVNMSDYTGTINTGVYVNGTFNGWCGDCNPMNDMGGGLWELTLPLSAGPIDYLFTVDGWTDLESFGPSDVCIDPVDDGFYNRYFLITGDAEIPTACFNTCSTSCLPASLDELESLVNISPNPTSDYINIETSSDFEMAEVISMSGRMVKEKSLINGNCVFDLSDLTGGVYFIRLSGKNDTHTVYIIKN
jgi:hypothetical protein